MQIKTPTILKIVRVNKPIKRKPLDESVEHLDKKGFFLQNDWAVSNTIPDDGAERASAVLKWDSMETKENLSIPKGSLLYLKRLSFDFLLIPKDAPIVLMGLSNEMPYLICGTATYVDLVANCIRLEYWNKKHPGHWLNAGTIVEVFQVEQSEFGREIKVWV